MTMDQFTCRRMSILRRAGLAARRYAIRPGAAALAIALIVGLAPHRAGGDDYPRNLDIDVQRYQFHIIVQDGRPDFRGVATLTVAFRREGVTSFGLDLIGLSPGAPTGMVVDSVSVTEAGGAYRMAEGFEQSENRLTVFLREPGGAGAIARVRIVYGGIPSDGLIISTNKYGEATWFGDNWPNRARHWLPTVDHPYDKAAVEWIVDAPSRYQVVANGRLDEVTDLEGGGRRTRYVVDVPLPTKVMVIGVARFAVQHLPAFDGHPLQSWVYPQDRLAGFRDFAIAPRVLAYFTETFGPFPYEKLANVQSRTRYGGMENAGAIFYSEGRPGRAAWSEGLIAHETAHQWFGDSVSEGDWNHIWLSEGFATYATHLYYEATYGSEALGPRMVQDRQRVLRYQRANPDRSIVDPDITDPMALLDTNAYQRGSWFLHMLRTQVGDEVFFRGLRSYYDAYRDANALSEDLQRTMEEVSGADLGWFFRQWLYRSEMPRVEGTWEVGPDGTFLLELSQSDYGAEPFRLAVEVSVEAADGDEMLFETVILEGSSAQLVRTLPAVPSGVTLDPRVRLLAEISLTSRIPGTPQEKR